MRNIFKMLVLGVVIIGVLVCVSGVYIVWVTGKERQARTYRLSYRQLQSLLEAVEDSKSHNGVWPSNMEQIVNSNIQLSGQMQDSYGHAIILIPYSEKTGCGAVVSYGRDGRPGGDKMFDQDIELRFPTNTDTNAQWNRQVGKRVCLED